MPTTTFMNLKKEKQQKLLDAAYLEFSSKLYNEASINKIIKNSNIPRGSFYMYFLDKEDLYLYLLDLKKEEVLKEFVNILDSEMGDLFNTFEKYFALISKKFQDGENNFFKNVILNMNYLMQNKMMLKKDKKNEDKTFYFVLNKKVDRSNLNIKDENDFKNMINVILGITFNSLIALSHFSEYKDRIYSDYISKLRLLKEGFYKEEER